MICPHCNKVNNSVTNSRLTTNKSEIRRRRECTECKKRFTTYEAIIPAKNPMEYKYTMTFSSTRMICADILCKYFDKCCYDLGSYFIEKKGEEPRLISDSIDWIESKRKNKMLYVLEEK